MIEKLAAMPDHIRALLESICETELSRKAAPDVFSLRENVLHLRDIDVEGYELEALRGGADLFRRNRGYAQIEAFGDNIAAVADWMAAAGWRTVERYGINSMFEKA